MERAASGDDHQREAGQRRRLAQRWCTDLAASHDGGARPQPKSGQERTALAEALRQNANLRQFAHGAGPSDAQIARLVDVARTERVPEGTFLASQGEVHADCFYVVQTGCFDVFTSLPEDDDVEDTTGQHTPRLVTTIGPGGSFGEIALLYSLPRATSVRARSDSVVWAIDGKSFSRNLTWAPAEKVQSHIQFLRRCEQLGELLQEISPIANGVRRACYQQGDVIIQRGERPTCCFFICEGSVTIRSGEGIATKEQTRTADGKEPRVLGEKALLCNSPSEFSVLVRSETAIVLILDRPSFGVLAAVGCWDHVCTGASSVGHAWAQHLAWDVAGSQMLTTKRRAAMREACHRLRVAHSASSLRLKSSEKFPVCGKRSSKAAVTDFVRLVEGAWDEKPGTVFDEVERNLHSLGDGHSARHSVLLAGLCCELDARFGGPASPRVARTEVALRQPLALFSVLLCTLRPVDLDRLLLCPDTSPGGERNVDVFGEAGGAFTECWDHLATGGRSSGSDDATLRTALAKWVKWLCLVGTLRQRLETPRRAYKILTGLTQLSLLDVCRCRRGDLLFWPGPCIVTLNAELAAAVLIGAGNSESAPPERSAILIIEGVSEGVEIEPSGQYGKEEDILLPPFSQLRVVDAVAACPVTLKCEYVGTQITDSLQEKCKADLHSASADLLKVLCKASDDKGHDDRLPFEENEDDRVSFQGRDLAEEGNSLEAQLQALQEKVRRLEELERTGPNAAQSVRASPSYRVQKEAAAEEDIFTIGEKVRVRDECSDRWRSGTVREKSPLKVKVDGWDEAFTWTCVEKVSPQRPAGQKVDRGDPLNQLIAGGTVNLDTEEVDEDELEFLACLSPVPSSPPRSEGLASPNGREDFSKTLSPASQRDGRRQSLEDLRKEHAMELNRVRKDHEDRLAQLAKATAQAQETASFAYEKARRRSVSLHKEQAAELNGAEVTPRSIQIWTDLVSKLETATAEHQQALDQVRKEHAQMLDRMRTEHQDQLASMERVYRAQHEEARRKEDVVQKSKEDDANEKAEEEAELKARRVEPQAKARRESVERQAKRQASKPDVEQKAEQMTKANDLEQHHQAELQRHLENARQCQYQKFVEIGEAFKTALWPSLTDTNYFKVLDVATPAYENAEFSGRRLLLNESFIQVGIDPTTLRCQSCNRGFDEGVTCDGKVTVSGGVGACQSLRLLPDKLVGADPDQVAVYIWTFSMTQGKPLYCRLNDAVLTDDWEELYKMRYVICGIRRWIRLNQMGQKEGAEILLYRGTPIANEQKHVAGIPLPKSKNASVTEKEHVASGLINRMPMFVAASQSKEKAMEFTKPGSPILEFRVKMGTSTCARIAGVSHFPTEEEWLMPAYTAVEYVGQRRENLWIGPNAKKALQSTLIVTYNILNWEDTKKVYEDRGQKIKSCLIMVELDADEDTEDDAKESLRGRDGDAEKQPSALKCSRPFRPCPPSGLPVMSGGGQSGGGRPPSRDTSSEEEDEEENVEVCGEENVEVCSVEAARDRLDHKIGKLPEDSEEQEGSEEDRQTPGLHRVKTRLSSTTMREHGHPGYTLSHQAARDAAEEEVARKAAEREAAKQAAEEKLAKQAAEIEAAIQAAEEELAKQEDDGESERKAREDFERRVQKFMEPWAKEPTEATDLEGDPIRSNLEESPPPRRLTWRSKTTIAPGVLENVDEDDATLDDEAAFEEQEKDMTYKRQTLAKKLTIASIPSDKEDLLAQMLAKIPFLSGSQACRDLASVFAPEEFAQGSVIVHQGQIGEHFFVITDGEAVVHATRGVGAAQKVATLHPGDYFGESALLENEPRSATVIAQSTLTCFRISRTQFKELGLYKKLACGHRQAVREAERREILTRPPSAKTEEERALITKALTRNTSLQDAVKLEDAQVRHIIDMMWRERVPEGKDLIGEGSIVSDYFYVVQEGQFDFLAVDEPINAKNSRTTFRRTKTRKQGTFRPGDSFGDKGLLRLSLQQAGTIRATEDSVVWVIDQRNFKSIVYPVTDAKLSEYVGYISRTKGLNSLGRDQKEDIAQTLYEGTYRKGESIIQQYEFCEHYIYILTSGEVSVSQDGEEVASLSAGGGLDDECYLFGEQALLQAQERAATVQVTSETAHVLILDGDSFSVIRRLGVWDVLGEWRSKVKQRSGGTAVETEGDDLLLAAIKSATVEAGISLSFRKLPQMNDHDLAVVRKAVCPLGRRLQRLNLDFAQCTGLTTMDELAAALQKLTGLKRLALNLCGCSNLRNVDKLMSALNSLMELSSLDLNLQDCKDLSRVGELGRLTSLVSLGLDLSGCMDLQNVDALGGGLEYLTALEDLKLSFEGCVGLESVADLGKGISSLSRLLSLDLNLMGCRGLQDVDDLGKGLAKINTLVSLVVSFQECTRLKYITEVAKAVEGLPFLENLNLECSNCSGLRLVDGFATGFSSASDLKSLDLDMALCGRITNMDDLGHGLSNIEGLEKLKVAMSHCDALRSIGGLLRGMAVTTRTKLTSLDLSIDSCSNVTDSNTVGPCLRSLPALLSLSLRLSGCTKELSEDAAVRELGVGLKSLTKLSSLTLHLNSCGLTCTSELGSGLSELKLLTRLELSLESCVNLKNVNELGQALGNLIELNNLSVSLKNCDSLEQIDDIGRALTKLAVLSSLTLNLMLCSKLMTLNEVVNGVERLQFLSHVDINAQGCVYLPRHFQTAFHTHVDFVNALQRPTEIGEAMKSLGNTAKAASGWRSSVLHKHVGRGDHPSASANTKIGAAPREEDEEEEPEVEALEEEKGKQKPGKVAAMKRAEDEVAAQRKAQEDAKRNAEEAAAKKKAEEEQTRKADEEASQRRAAEEMTARKKAEKEAAAPVLTWEEEAALQEKQERHCAQKVSFCLSEDLTEPISEKKADEGTSKQATNRTRTVLLESSSDEEVTAEKNAGEQDSTRAKPTTRARTELFESSSDEEETVEKEKNAGEKDPKRQTTRTRTNLLESSSGEEETVEKEKKADKKDPKRAKQPPRTRLSEASSAEEPTVQKKAEEETPKQATNRTRTVLLESSSDEETVTAEDKAGEEDPGKAKQTTRARTDLLESSSDDEMSF